MRKVADARRCWRFTKLDGSTPCAGNHGAPIGNAEARADSRGMINKLTTPSGDGNLFHHSIHEWRNNHWEFATKVHACLLPGDGNASIALAWIVGDHGATNAVLQLRDHLAGAVVGAWICAEYQ